ncbi:P-loop NTPase family protein [Arthrobacter sp. Hz1]
MTPADNNDPFQYGGWTPDGSFSNLPDDFSNLPDDLTSLDDPDAAEPQAEPSAEDRAKGAKVQPPRGPSQSAQLVEIARSHYRVVKSTEGKVYAIEHDRPGIALDLRGKAGLRQRIGKFYYDTKNKVASDTSLKEMLNVLEGDALTAEEVPVFLRFGKVDGSIVIDSGAPEGNAIVVSSQGIELVEQSPILFRRSSLISPMPKPVIDPAGGMVGLDGLRALINVSEEGFRLLVGWMVAACIPEIPHPFLALVGQQGTAKTTALKMLITLISPSPAPVGSAPTTPDDWAVTAYQEPVIGLDNVSHLPPWFQDALCKAVTGDGYKKREKYSDLDVTVLHFQRVIGMTSIDPGGLQGDVADRLLQVELDPIPKSSRRTDREVSQQFEQARPSVHGAILLLLSKVLGELPGVELDEMPRMADFARVLAALDNVTGWATLNSYLSATEHVAADVIEGDQFASAVRDLVESQHVWNGTSTELLAMISPDKPPRSWPKTPSRASGQIKRITPALAAIGISVSEPQREAGTGKRRFTISRTDTPLCAICNGEMSRALTDQGESTHPTCYEPNELIPEYS